MFGIGEHHRAEFLDPAPAIILAAAATRTKNIRLTSAVTVLSAADPVRVFQEFATLDLISHGRAEIVAGRGSFIESFPLFGLTTGRLRLALRGKTGTIPEYSRQPACALVRKTSRGAYRPGHFSTAATESVAHLGGRRRYAGIFCARGCPQACR